VLETQRDLALVSVVDDGIGIDPGHHDRIFERFYRVDSGRSRDVGGTGLGLALVKHLCLAMHAEVVFNSAPGHGSTFTLRLPTREPQRD
jgi:two-component system phosphate regulon sensor histidine kinase PhoR